MSYLSDFHARRDRNSDAAFEAWQAADSAHLYLMLAFKTGDAQCLADASRHLARAIAALDAAGKPAPSEQDSYKPGTHDRISPIAG